MKKIAILGLLIIIMPLLGFPIFWENVIYVILGSLIFLQAVYFSFKLNKVMIKKSGKIQEVYIENNDRPIKEN